MDSYRSNSKDRSKIMAMIVNTNIASLNAQRNLLKSSYSLNTSMTRLSSGLRITSAKDDKLL